jgi:hypothetical protein
MSALGQKQTFAPAKSHVRFTSKADIGKSMSAKRQKQYSSFVERFCQREFALTHWARYMIAAIESGFPPTTNASSSFTRYRKGLSAVASPDFILPLTWPQIISKGSPNELFLMTRLMSTNSAYAGPPFSPRPRSLLFSEQDRMSRRKQDRTSRQAD